MRRGGGAALLALAVFPVVLFAQQSPWERAALNLEATFTGPLARSLALVAIVVGGLIGSSLIGIFSTKGPQIAGVNFLSFVGFVLSAILGLWLLWGVLRSGRL